MREQQVSGFAPEVSAAECRSSCILMVAGSPARSSQFYGWRRRRGVPAVGRGVSGTIPARTRCGHWSQRTPEAGGGRGPRVAGSGGDEPGEAAEHSRQTGHRARLPALLDRCARAAKLAHSRYERRGGPQTGTLNAGSRTGALPAGVQRRFTRDERAARPLWRSGVCWSCGPMCPRAASVRSQSAVERSAQMGLDVFRASRQGRSVP